MEFNIKDSTHYLVIAGSHSYGTASWDSDYDLRGWAIPPESYFLTFDKKFEQNDQEFQYKDYPFNEKLQRYIQNNNLRVPTEDEQIDHCIYDIRKFFTLCAGCNPNVLENLFVADKDILVCDYLGRSVRDHRDLFLSARAKHTFAGYAIAQLKRINTHRRWLLNPVDHKPVRSEYGLPEMSLISPDQRGAAESLIDRQVREWLFQDVDQEVVNKTVLAELHSKLGEFVARILSSKDLVLHYLDEKELINTARICAMKKLGMTENYLAILQAEKLYRNALTEWTQYQTWVKTRNPARAELEKKFGFDAKHAMQLARLLRSGKELLLTGKVNVYREDAKDLLAIRNGAWTYEQVIKFVGDTDKELTEIYDKKLYVVPHKPNMVALSNLCEDAIKRAIT